MLQLPEVECAINRIGQYCDHAGISINALSKQLGISQAALARFMAGERKTVTPTASRVLAHIDTRHKWHNYRGDSETRTDLDSSDMRPGYEMIEDAVRSVWDGGTQTAELLAGLIRALKPALDVAKSA